MEINPQNTINFGLGLRDLRRVTASLPQEFTGPILDISLTAGARAIATRARRAGHVGFKDRTGRARRSIKAKAARPEKRKRIRGGGDVVFRPGRSPAVQFGGTGAEQANILEVGRQAQTSVGRRGSNRGKPVRVSRARPFRVLDRAARAFSSEAVEAVTARYRQEIERILRGELAPKIRAALRKSIRG